MRFIWKKILIYFCLFHLLYSIEREVSYWEGFSYWDFFLEIIYLLNEQDKIKKVLEIIIMFL
jgi:hypothetical protein